MSFATRRFLFLFAFSLSFTAWAFDVPSLTGPVVDQPGLLSTSTKNQLSVALKQVFQNGGPQVQVFIVNSLDGIGIEDAAIKTFDAWKLGTEKGDNGALLLIAPKEKKLRIEVGRGLEGDIPDMVAKRIIADTIAPYFKQGDFDMGVAQGVQSILYYAKASTAGADFTPEAPPANHKEKKGTSPFVLLLIFGIWVLIFIFNPSLALALLFSGRGGGRGGGGGGGWSGGGGSSAGGGASGDW